MVKLVWLFAFIISGSSIISNHELSFNSAIAMTQNNSTAKVLEVQTRGEANNYTFGVTVSSPDTGCDRYADWWEVITPEGELLYRRVLLHSHVDEQPFERSGSPVKIQPQQQVIVRVHMSADGYSPLAKQGTVESGFAAVTLSEDFAENLESVEPLPKNCAF